MVNPDGLAVRPRWRRPTGRGARTASRTPGAKRDRHRPQPQLRLPLGAVALVRQARPHELPRPAGLLGARGPRHARLRAQPRRRWAAAHPRRTSRSTPRASWCSGPTATRARTCPPDMTALDARDLPRPWAAPWRRRTATAEAVERHVPHAATRSTGCTRAQRIFSFTFEMYPPRRQRSRPALSARRAHRRGDASATARPCSTSWSGRLSLSRHRAGQASLLRAALRRPRGRRGWTVDPGGTDTATGGRWARGDAGAARHSSWGRPSSGQAVLVTGRGPAVATWTAAGRRSARRSSTSPPTAPARRCGCATGSGYPPSAGRDDGLRVRLVDRRWRPRWPRLRHRRRPARRREPRWRSLADRCPTSCAGGGWRSSSWPWTRAADATVEAGVDDVRITVVD